MPAAPAPRPDRRRARTRAALLDAGKALFAERAVDGVSVDDIVAAAGVAKGSFYNHFPDKDALAAELALIARRGVESLAARLSAGVADPRERVARALCGFARQALEDPVDARAQLRLFQGPRIPDAAMDAGVRADVKAGLAGGQFGGVSLEASVLMAVGIVQIAVGRVLTHDDPRQAAAVSRELAFGLLRGLGVDDATARTIAARAAADVFTGPVSAGRSRPP